MRLTDNRAKEALAMLYAALRTEHGVAIRAPDAYEAVRTLNIVKADSGDLAFSVLKIQASPLDPKHEVFIKKIVKEQENVK